LFGKGDEIDRINKKLTSFLNDMSKTIQKRVVAYIDGFNLYHSIANNLPPYFKWVNYRKLVEAYLDEWDELVNIFLFTASPTWDEERLRRHHDFMDIQSKLYGIKIISGNYTYTKKKFNADKMKVVDPEDAFVKPRRFTYRTFEEKQTDVNIALSLFEWWILDMYEKALIFSGDSDLAPAIHRVRHHRKDKEFKCILPFLGHGRVMIGACKWSYGSINQKILESCLLDDSLAVYGKMIANPYK
jgi:uncharacterized LabA/DUF88 family protein